MRRSCLRLHTLTIIITITITTKFTVAVTVTITIKSTVTIYSHLQQLAIYSSVTITIKFTVTITITITGEIDKKLAHELVRHEPIVVPDGEIDRLRRQVLLRNVQEDNCSMPLRVQRPRHAPRSSLALGTTASSTNHCFRYIIMT